MGSGLVLFLAVFFSPELATALVDFEPARRDFLCGNLPRDLTAIDFNEDGLLDLACVRFTFSSPGIVALMRGDGHGGFSRLRDLQTAGGATSILAADFNEDGHMDLITSGFLENTIGLHPGDGAGGFAFFSIPFPGTSPFHVNGADLDRDGHLDLVAGGTATGDGMVRVLRGDGTGEFTLLRTLTGGTVPQHTAIGDLNSDGALDLAIADAQGGVILYLGDGKGGFAPGPSVEVGTMPVWIAIREGTDWDNEPTHMAVAVRGADQVAVFRWDSTQDTFTLVTEVAAPIDPISVAFVPPTFFHDPSFHNPSLRDPTFGVNPSSSFGLAVVAQTSNQLTIWRTLADKPLVIITQDSPTAVRIADWTRDGSPDFAIPGFNTESITFLKGARGTTVIAPRLDIGGEPAWVRSCDLNGDAMTDLVVLRIRDRRLTGLVARESPEFSEGWELGDIGAPFSERPSGLAVLDLGDDALPDFAVGESSGSLLYVLKSSTGYSREDFEMVATGVTAIEGQDLDGDLADDLAATNYLGNRVSVHFSDQAGGFLPPIRVPVGEGPVSMVVSDLNGDGLGDLVTADNLVASLSVVLQEPGRSFSAPLGVAVQAGVSGPVGVAAGDLNGDGDADLVASGDLGLEIFRGDGTGHFVSSRFIGTVAEFEGVRVADLDADGWLEVIAADRHGNAVIVLPGPALGPSPQTPTVLGFGVDAGPSEIEVVELDGDGRPDLAVAARRGDRLTFLLTAGSTPTPGSGALSVLSSGAGSAPRARVLVNSFHEPAALAVDLDVPGRVVLRIYNVAGRLVATPFSGPLPAGRSMLPWTGRNESEAFQSRGVYFYRLDLGQGHTARGKIVRF